MNKTLKGFALTALCTAISAQAIAQETPKPGGDIIVTYQNDVATLDPAIGYDWQNWSMIKSLFDGLMDYEPGTTELRTDLAESYEISEDGLTYTFTLRPGVKFHNGREMTSADVKYSLERTVNPKTQSPGAGFFSAIEGFDAMANGEATELSGITTPDERTVQITLSAPDATFLHLMALNFASVVPREAVEQWGSDFGKHPVGTGAYKLDSWALGQRLTFAKNEDYFRDGIPYIDTINFEIGQEPNVALLRLHRGEVDIAGDGIPPAQFVAINNDPAFKELMVVGDQLHTGYLTMNVTIPPLDNVKVRQAINMAINKERIIRVINGRATPANQPLPPAMPGYDESYEGYPYDPEKAKALLAEAGFPNGFETEMFVANTTPQPRIAQAIQQDLAEIGIDTKIKSLAQANVIAAGGEQDQAPMIWSGGMAWIADFPDPSNFWGPILGCEGAVPGGWNWAWYCNEELDAKADEANAMVAPEQQEARAKLWGDIFTATMDDAPWVPVFNEQRYTVHSARMGGADALYVDPVHVPVNYDYIWVK
ncbi:ABC transporter substrate-binding protein [Halomonas sp. McH1-25]|uniref:ABC transporter substrate-binding protein n=1 Tax=unclassified Halomonas TaxID=2609666 RepID=UPI001EF52C58|nr:MULTISPECIES: ABC transporter substrate-binding protein [unclassified Halomonas]MCG7599945.1 ABC transporter substrate-binding protein [Halomonas sp. McH1-25]MCP1342636.1 ABC transporter substrate-binding protein [Halomonas sp. FL8]MCP1361351.1 ABC transporter substrate-binding protein [Halomonas sp. BBD45]MCP1363847.1 ABC transporter substrate-binding protein [Halomonas sp. BBD48]